MRRVVAIGAALAVSLVTTGAGAQASSATAAAVGAVQVAAGLAFPAAFTFAPDGTIFYGERLTGAIHVYDPGTGSDRVFATIPSVASTGEQGLLGLALHPNYPRRRFVFAYATRNVGGTLRNQIIRLKDVGGVGKRLRVIWSADTVAAAVHNGGHIAFGPDRALYAIVGEGGAPGNSQSLSNSAGKLLRISATGRIPAEDPFPGSPIWAFGVRNSFGFGFDPLTGSLWETENGPGCNDELNLITRGANYGWGPSQTCTTPPSPPRNTNQDGPDPVLPQAWFSPTIAPVGMAFCAGCGIPDEEGKFLFGAFNDREIRSVTLSADRTTITDVEVVYTHSSSPLSMERSPDGALYFSDPTGIWKLVQT
jgi:glucose/arabinose dehydrogenase